MRWPSSTRSSMVCSTVAKERGMPIDALHARWQEAAASIRAARRVEPDHTALRAEGPDARAVLELVRTYA